MNDVAPLLSVRGITKRFGGFTAVDKMSFDLKPGAIGGLIGPNGEPLRPIPVDRFDGDKSFPIIDAAWKPAYWNPVNSAACYAPEPVS